MTSPDQPSPCPSPPSIFRPWQSYLSSLPPALPPHATPVTATSGPSTQSKGVSSQVDRGHRSLKRPAPHTDSLKRPASHSVSPRPSKQHKTGNRSEGSRVGVSPVALPTALDLASPTLLAPPGLPPATVASALGLSLSTHAVLAHMPPTNGPLPGLSPFMGPGGIGPSGLAGPLVPLLDMLVPAAEVERVCARRPRPKRFGCGQCGSAFSNKGQLKGHLRIHTGERPFICGHAGCHKRFTRNEELTRHRRIHSGARPFPCPLCDKRFGRKDHLKKHVRTHQRVGGPVPHSGPLMPPGPPVLPPNLPPVLHPSYPLLHHLRALQHLQ